MPILADGSSFEAASSQFTGKLGELQRYSGLTLHHDYFEEAMERLRTQFLKQPGYALWVPIARVVLVLVVMAARRPAAP